MDSVKKILELGRIFLLTQMVTQIRPIVRELGGEVTMTLDSIRFSLDGLFHQTKIDFEEQYDQKLNTNVPLIKFKTSSNDGTEMQKSQSLMISPRISRNTPVHSVAEAISARWGINFLGLFKYIKNPTTDQSLVSELKIQMKQNSQLIKSSFTDYLNQISFDNGTLFETFENLLKEKDSSLIDRFQSFEHVAFLQNDWNFYQPFLDLFNKRYQNYISKCLVSFPTEINNLIPQSLFNYADYFKETYYNEILNILIDDIRVPSDPSLSNNLLAMNIYSYALENQSTNLNLLLNIFNCEKINFATLITDLFNNILNSSSSFANNLIVSFSHGITFGSSFTKSDEKASEIKDLENAWWCIYLEEKTEKLMDLADGFEEESITAQMISISNLLIGSFQLIGGYIMADKVEELHNLGILKDLAYQGYLVWANDAIWNGILELAHTIIEFILELITPNDLAADSISAEISAYLETLDWMTDPNFYGDKITLQDAKDLDEFLRYQGLIQGWATDVGIIIGEITENNYVIIGFAVIAHICNVVHGAVFAYSTKQSIAFVLIIIFGFFGL